MLYQAGLTCLRRALGRALLASCALLGASLGPAALAQVAETTDSDDPRAEASAPQERQADLQEVAERIVRRTNAFRRRHDLSPLEASAELQAAAQDFAEFMARTNKYGHTADGRRPVERASEQGYEHCIVLENIAYAYHSLGYESDELTQQFMRGWRNSPGHRKNMLDSAVSEIGVGAARSEESGHYYAVQMFGRPQSEAIEFQVVNESAEAARYSLVGEDGERRSFDLPPRAIQTHRRCRPSELRMERSDREETFAAQDGSRYVIGADGEVAVENAPASPGP